VLRRVLAAALTPALAATVLAAWVVALLVVADPGYRPGHRRAVGEPVRREAAQEVVAGERQERQGQERVWRCWRGPGSRSSSTRACAMPAAARSRSVPPWSSAGRCGPRCRRRSPRGPPPRPPGSPAGCRRAGAPRGGAGAATVLAAWVVALLVVADPGYDTWAAAVAATRVAFLARSTLPSSPASPRTRATRSRRPSHSQTSVRTVVRVRRR
jgi:hypothetical protein